MALVPLALDLVASTLRRVAADCPSKHVLSLGYPDILVNRDHLVSLFGESVAASVEYRPDSREIIRWHNAAHITDRIPEAGRLFSLLGFQLEVIDVAQARGGEIIQDLNTPIPEALKHRYALVIDAGTLEHCFNIATAACNVAEMTAPGGAVIHGNPLNMYNHGFYNLSPTWYHDFYGENGFAVEVLKAVYDPLRTCRFTDVPAYDRFGDMPDNCTLLAMARRIEIKPVRWPTQRKYRENPHLKG